MRGYGESDLPLSAESYRFEHLVTDVKDIVEYLGERSAGEAAIQSEPPHCSDSVSSQKINLFTSSWTALGNCSVA